MLWTESINWLFSATVFKIWFHLTVDGTLSTSHQKPQLLQSSPITQFWPPKPLRNVDIQHPTYTNWTAWLVKLCHQSPLHFASMVLTTSTWPSFKLTWYLTHVSISHWSPQLKRSTTIKDCKPLFRVRYNVTDVTASTCLVACHTVLIMSQKMSKSQLLWSRPTVPSNSLTGAQFDFGIMHCIYPTLPPLPKHGPVLVISTIQIARFSTNYQLKYFLKLLKLRISHSQNRMNQQQTLMYRKSSMILIDLGRQHKVQEEWITSETDIGHQGSTHQYVEPEYGKETKYSWKCIE